MAVVVERRATVETLKTALRGASAVSGPKPIISTGITSLDGLLPGGGWTAGSVVEWWLADGAGGVELAMHTVASAVANNKTWCLITAKSSVCPLPAFANSAQSRGVLVRPRTDAEAWWAAEQALRSPAVGCAWSWVDDLPERVGRRWMVAAENGGGVGFVFRSPGSARPTNWATVRLAVTPVAGSGKEFRRARLDVLYCRGSLGGPSLLMEWSHATGALRLVSKLVNSTPSARRAIAATAPARRVC